jgi:uncharacterized protein (TIGR00369 family)
MLINHELLKKITNVEGQACFGCGKNNAHGLQMQFLTDDQRVYSFVTVPSTMTGWDKAVHGGIVSTILDEIMGWSVIYLQKKIGVTKTITIDFIKSINSDERLTVVGAIQEVQSDRKIVATGEIYSREDVLCAKATGTFAAMPAKTAVRLGIMSPDYMERFRPILDQTAKRDDG